MDNNTESYEELFSEDYIEAESHSKELNSYIKKLSKRVGQLNSILNNIDVGLLLQGPNSEIFLSNDRAFELLGLTKEQLIGKTSFDPTWNVIHEDGSPFLSHTHPVPKAIKSKMPVKDVIMGVYHPSKKDRVWLLVSAIPILNENDTVKHVVCSFIDISKRKEAEAAMKEANEIINQKNLLLQELAATLELESTVDMLTGLYNRRYMLKRMDEEIINYKKNGTKFSIIIGDIDFFKRVNDTYGHDFGDFVLKTVSEVLKSTLEEKDCICRWGGEEFLILLSKTDLETSQNAAEKMRQKIQEKIFEYNDRSLFLTMTFGICIYSDNENIDDIIKKADNALYHGKINGRNCIVTSTS